MSTYKTTYIDYTTLAQRDQFQTRLILIPPKRILLDNRPELITEKYDTDFHIDGYLQNTNLLLNTLNQIRGWHQNATNIYYHIKQCSQQYNEIIPLIDFQFTTITIFPSGNPYEYVEAVACKSLLNSLTCEQLRNELRHTTIKNFSHLTQHILTTLSLIKSRPKCPLCSLHVLHLRKHLKTHSKTNSHHTSETKYKLQRQANKRQYFKVLSETSYDFKQLYELFD